MDSPEQMMWEKQLEQKARALEGSETAWDFPRSRATLGPGWLKGDPKWLEKQPNEWLQVTLGQKGQGQAHTALTGILPIQPVQVTWRLQNLNRNVIVPDKTIWQEQRKWSALCNLYLMHLVAARTASWVESSFCGICCDMRYITNSSRHSSIHVGLQWKPDTWYYRNTSNIHAWQAWKTLGLT